MEDKVMTKAMTKYQLEHFQSKVRRQFRPLIEDQELLVKQFKTKATDVAVAKLSKKLVLIKSLINLDKLKKC